jgi:hypothetical protein
MQKLGNRMAMAMIDHQREAKQREGKGREGKGRRRASGGEMEIMRIIS